jgi:hypothetical protein
LTKNVLLACLLFLLSPALFAQSAPSAEGGRRSIWVGAEFSSFNPDWGCPNASPFSCWDHRLLGVAAFADANRLIGRIGMEGEARWMPWHGVSGISESNYLIGPRFQVLGGRRLSLNAKFLAGGATFQQRSNTGGWAVFAPGATLGYRISPRLVLRGDYEYQIWPGFVGTNGPRGLSPNGFSVGASYRLFH